MAKPDSWLEISLVCSSELAEAVAEVLARYAPDGVVLSSVTAFDQEAFEQRPTGEMRVSAYLPRDAALEKTRHELEVALWHLGQIVALPQPEYQVIADQDWMSAWKEHYHPIRLGQNLMVMPAWADPALADGYTPIIISPDMAFGTGTHPSTQLCLVALEKYGCLGKDVLDIGCGSGILSIAAVRLGASRVLGVDIDPQAIPSCQRNAALNGMPERIQFELGTHTDILARTDGLNQASVVLANILAPVLLSMFDTHLADLVSPGGLLILGGILDTQAESIVSAGARDGLRSVDTLRSEDWVVLVLQKD